MSTTSVKPISSHGKVTAAAALSPLDAYRADFEEQSHGPAWLTSLRSEGMRCFETAGFPTMKDEDWHFTSVARIAETTFRVSPDIAVSHKEVQRFAFGRTDWTTVVLVNGRCSPALGSPPGEHGVRVQSIAAALADGNPALEPLLGRVATPRSGAFTALNTAFLSDGAFIEIAPGTEASMPIHLLFISDGSAGVSHPRNVIHAGANSRCSVVESYVSLDAAAYFTNAVTEIQLEEAAALAHYKLQRESDSAFHVGTVEVRQLARSSFSSFSFATGGALSRTNIYTVLDGEAAECNLNGLYLTDGTQHTDHQTRIEHKKPNCPSREVYKGVLDGRSHGVFNGKVYVHPEAQKTDGKQSNNNLLLSPTARIDTKPQLEIFADDVKCTHGATVGRLDEMAMFYLNSRGIGPDAARVLLTYAFAADVLETIELDPLRRSLEEMVLARFAGTAAA